MAKILKCRLAAGALMLPVMLLSACHLRPNWGPPGTIGQQRARAIVHDPFPDNDLGPPIVSGRPLGFDRPSSEAKRLQQDNPFANRPRNPIPPPSPFGF